MMKLVFAALVLWPVAQDPRELKPGLLGEYFLVGEEIDDFPTPKRLKPHVRKTDPAIDFKDTAEGFAGTELKDYFFVRWTGVIRLPEDGAYRFTLDSDDGSRLLIDGKLVVDNGGLHGMGERHGPPVELKAGNRALKLEFFENERGAGCKLLWTRPAGEKEIVPAGVLFHPKDPDLDKP